MSDSKNKKRVHVLKSPEQVKTVRYKKELDALYGGFIFLPAGVLATDYDVCVDHQCAFCGEVVSTKPSTMVTSIGEKQRALFGRGCTVCKTNSTHIKELIAFQEELKKAHNGKFSLCYLPQRFQRDNGNYRETFKCNDCGLQHYQTCRKIVDKKFKCLKCEELRKQGERTKWYRDRLHRLYGGAITSVGRYSDTVPMHHSCDRYHTWLASAKDMLHGVGCKACKNAVTVKQIQPFMYRNQKFSLRTELEAKCIKGMASKAGQFGDIRTSLDFPIPVLYGKRPPAFFHPKSRCIADVVKEKTFRKQLKKFRTSFERATAMGLHYGVIFLTKQKNKKTKEMEEKVIGLWTEDWMTGKREMPKEGISDDTQIGSGNTRNNIFAPKIEGADLPFDV